MRAKSRVDTVFVLLVFCVFAVSVFLVLILGGSTYRNMIDIAQEGQNERIVLSYIRTKTRHIDDNGGIMVGYFGGVPSLMLMEDLGGIAFVTRIYWYNGWVYELFHEYGIDFAPDEGVPLLRADSLSFTTLEGGMIRVTTGGHSLLLSPRTSAVESGGLF